MSNSIITLLNLACIKHTNGSPLPSSLLGGDWKYILDEDKKKAVWSPSPYSYPFKEVCPTDDPEHKILRYLVVDELKEVFNFDKTMFKAKTYLVGFTVFATLFVQYDCSEGIKNVLTGNGGLNPPGSVSAPQIGFRTSAPWKIFTTLESEDKSEIINEIRKIFTQNIDDLTGCFPKKFKKTLKYLFDIGGVGGSPPASEFYDYIENENGDLRGRLRSTNTNFTLTDDDFEETIKQLGGSSLCGVRLQSDFPITSIIKALVKYGFDIPSGLTDYRRGHTWNKFFKKRSVRKIEQKIKISDWTKNQKQVFLSSDGQIKRTQKAYKAFYDCAINSQGWWGNRLCPPPRINWNGEEEDPSPFAWNSWRDSTSRGKRAVEWLGLEGTGTDSVSVQRPLFTEELVRIYAPNKVLRDGTCPNSRKKIEEKLKNNFPVNPTE